MRNESKKCQPRRQEETSALQIIKRTAQLEAMKFGSIFLEKTLLWEGTKKEKDSRDPDKLQCLDRAPTSGQP